MAIDRMDWHYGGDFPSGLPTENGGTHIGIYLAWIINNGLEGDFHKEESAAELEKVRKREMTGRDFLQQACDEKFWDEDLNEEGYDFTQYYYSNEEGYVEDGYIKDYENTLVEGSCESFYHVEDTWDSYDKIAPIVSMRYKEWKTKK